VPSDTKEFSRLVVTLLARYFAQNAHAVQLVELEAVATQLAALVADRGLPPPLEPGQVGAPGGMAESECSNLVARVLNGTGSAFLAEPARQLIKACFYPEFTVCRNSFCETTPNGACRRQELARARKRISGAHCVDCPLWERYAQADHSEFLAAQWKSGQGEFEDARSIFLPEDFRVLRKTVRLQARRNGELE
jgi:hypothetical protein